MSHFTVVACVDDPERLDDVMAPFDENLEVKPYRSYEDGGPAGHWAVSSLREHAGLNPDDATLTWAQVAEAHNRRYGDEQPLLVDDDGRAYTMSTRNPQSKWDYWRVGGQWGGYFPYRPEHASAVMKPERGWDSPESIESLHCDGGPKFALNLDALRGEKAIEAAARYEKWLATVAGTPEALPWRVFADNISENGYTIERARKEYHAQPRIQALQGTDFRYYDDPIEAFSKPKALYVAHAEAQAVPGYATLTTDGRWMAPGTMGWFAMDDADDSSRIGYLEAANAYIGALPDSVFLLAVDCHI